MALLKNIYPKAYGSRPPLSEATLRKARISFFQAAGKNFIFLQVLFLGLFCYIFGSLFRQAGHTHNLKIVFVDYDGGEIGQAVRAAYSSLHGANFPTLVEQTPSQLPSSRAIFHEVCDITYWGALYITQGASSRLRDALTSSSPYNASDTMAYIWNEARYAAVVDAAVSLPIQQLSNAARIAYTRSLATTTSTALNLTLLANPWSLQSQDIQPTPQGSRAIYNTIALILVLIQEFFYLATINGLLGQFRLYTRIPAWRIILVRGATSLAYTFCGSLCVAGAIWAFRAGWDVGAGQFFLTWMVLWLFAHVNFLTLDVFTVWLPHPFVPMALIAWIIINVTSVILPLELSAAFYRVGYAMPAHTVFNTMLDIWSRGCNPTLRYSLPTLFAWEVATFGLSALGVLRRCHCAVLGEERQAREFKERVDAAVAFEMAREAKEKGRQQDGKSEEKEADLEGSASSVTGTARGEDDSEGMREELAAVMERITTRQRREQRASVSFGPSFSLPFGRASRDEDGHSEHGLVTGENAA
ncbi:hypothetical protein B0T18DRAFT_432634 [Schizothecium vesticola]|uniref:DUF3533 domain-containing protein n=1 Tax=Schizothecium vesticola TaxID=314040 RepID=A0AA40K0P2_9PEZI|nr:hypothetical protein B0T18DRAFT_432634 [Schizothecium vesticola]